MRWRAVWAALAVVGCLLIPAAPASATGSDVLYASPTGSGIGFEKCTEALPCTISAAVSGAIAGDQVQMAAGHYELAKFSGLNLEKKISVGGKVGEPAVIETTESAGVHVLEKAQTTLHDLRIEGEGSLELESGTAERVFVAHTGVGAEKDACELNEGTTMRDSVCWTLETNEEEEGVSHALDISATGENQDKPVVLRNVTAIADTKTGNAVHMFAAASAHLRIDAANLIAYSVNGVDIAGETGESGFPDAHLTIVNSDFGEAEYDAPKTEVTPIGTSGNVGALPPFLDLAGGDFRVGADSPTLDGGRFDPSLGAVDLEGNGRSQAKCFGALPVPDMGAFERTPTANCPPPPPPPPRPVEPPKPVFRVLSLLLNKKTGGGHMLVEVPPGTGVLSLTGSGVKLVRRTAPAEGGVISVPILPWAITRVRLAKTGKTKVHLRVAFEGRVSGLEEWAQTVLLRKKVGAGG